jgi:hypothetical protein
MAEALPTGTFGDARPQQPTQPTNRAPGQPDPNAARHRAELLAALAGHNTPQDAIADLTPVRPTTRHLRALPPADAA